MDEIWRFETERFAIVFSVEAEELDPANCFESEDDVELVRSGAVDWFGAVVRVRDRETGEVLGEDRLSGCAYRTAMEFRDENLGPAADVRRLKRACRAKLARVRHLRANGYTRQIPNALNELAATRRELARFVAYETDRRRRGARGGSYFGDMVREAIGEARLTIERHRALMTCAA